MWFNLDKPRMMSEFWKRRVDPYEPEGGHAGGHAPVLAEDDDYPAPHTRGSVLRSVLVWAGVIIGVVVLLGVVLIVPGLVF